MGALSLNYLYLLFNAMRTSKQAAQMSGSDNSADVIIIGSGFGGAVAADRLARAGLKVRILERGPWRRTLPVLAGGVDQAVALPVQNRPSLIMRNIRSVKGPKEIRLNRRGMLEMHVGNGVKTLTSSNVGGGSHIWSALVARPDDPAYWDGRGEGVSETIMAPHYAQVASELGAVRPTSSETIPNHASHAWRDSGWFAPVDEQEQYPQAFLYPAQNGGCNGKNRQSSELNGKDGMFGSPSAAKANVETIYLLPHLDGEVSVHDMHEVTTLAHRGTLGWKVAARDHNTGKVEDYYAPRVVLAAGTMNSIKILFASQEAGGVNPIQSLGKGFGTNGDCMGVWVPGHPYTDSSQGTPIHGRLKTDDHPLGVNLIVGGMDAIPMPGWLPDAVKRRLAHFSRQRYQLITMGIDQANGSISFSKGRLKLDYDLNDSDVYQSAYTLFDRLAKHTGRPIQFNRKSAVTVHPLGGCRVADRPAEGVVDGEGQVYGNAGLYISDASILPQPTGGPPSLTIAAWSAHVAASLLR
jgi:cholesterol oxidase